MHPLWWFGIGVVAGWVILVPLVRAMLRRGERRARSAERRARDAERLAELGTMTGGLAHEIKNPLSTIGLNAQLLREELEDSDISEPVRSRIDRRLASLQREIDRLRDILTDFLQFAGRLKIEPEVVDVGRIADEVGDFFLPQCEQSGVLLRTQVPSQPTYAAVDEKLLKQAVLNLLINAVQAIERSSRNGRGRGEIIIRVTADAHVELSVVDTGPGIAPEELEEIFRPYVSKRSGGTGLGLAIAKRITEEHGGSLTVSSVPGQGSEFRIQLPRHDPN